MALKRFVNGAEGEPFFQKRAPEKRPDWIGTVELRFPSGRTADEVVLSDEAALAWVINLGCIDLNPHPVRASDLDHPDELRVDLDPVPGVEWPQIRDVALVARDVLADFGLTGWPKTSGSRGIHIYARIQPQWEFGDVRRAAVSVAREIERRAPDLATSKWWKEERHGVFVDYNQNAKDRTVASAYSIRPVADARVSAPLTWEEVPTCDPAEYTIGTMPARFAGSATRGRGWTRRPGRWTGCSSWRPGTRRRACPTRRGRRTMTSRTARRPGSSRPSAVQPGTSGTSGKARRARQSTKPLIEIARAATKDEAMAGLERWKERHPEVWPLLEPATCWSTACAAAARSGTGSGSTSSTSRRPSARRRSRWKSTTTPGPGCRPGNP